MTQKEINTLFEITIMIKKMNGLKNNSNKKECSECKGKGRINERWEREWQNTSWIPTQGEYVQVLKSDVCPRLFRT